MDVNMFRGSVFFHSFVTLYLLWLLNPGRGAQTSASTATCLSPRWGGRAEPQSRCIHRTGGGGDIGCKISANWQCEEVKRLNTSAGGWWPASGCWSRTTRWTGRAFSDPEGRKSSHGFLFLKIAVYCHVQRLTIIYITEGSHLYSQLVHKKTL